MEDKAGYVAELATEIEDAKPARIGQIRRYLEALDGQPDFITSFDGDAFKELVENITVRPNGDMTVCFKDGRKIKIPKNSGKENQK